MSSDFHIKPEIRILGVDDSALLNEKVMIVGTVFRGGDWIDGVLRSEITRDGLDATEVMVTMIKNSRHYGQLRIVMLDGITYGGFNVVDIEELHLETGLPIIVVMRSYPDFEKIRAALRHFSDGEVRWSIIKKAGKVEKLVTEKNRTPIYIQKTGIGIKSAEKIVRLTSIRSNIPEPLRVAHLIATGIIFGESRGGA